MPEITLLDLDLFQFELHTDSTHKHMRGSGMAGNLPVAPGAPLRVFQETLNHGLLLVRGQGLAMLGVGTGSIENRVALGTLAYLSR